MRLLLFVFLSLFLTSYSWGLPDCPSDPEAYWDNCHGAYNFDNGRYVGEWKDNKHHGQGAYTWANGEKYVGEWRQDKPHGQGTYTWADGNKYIGAYKNGDKNGQGTYIVGYDHVFEGRPLKYGDRFVGEFVEGWPKGEGIYYHADGRIEEGYWERYELVRAEKNHINKAEVATYSNLLKCPSDPESYWDNCFGTFTFDNGDQYVGGFKKDKPNGQGTYTWADGGKYVGVWRDGGKLEGTQTWASGNKYVGKYKNGKAHGQGTYTWANGNKYIGEYKVGERHGTGTYIVGYDHVFEGRTLKHGDRFVGEFANGFPKGDGIYYHADGRVEEGYWERLNLVRAKETTQNNYGSTIESNFPECPKNLLFQYKRSSLHKCWTKSMRTNWGASKGRYTGEWLNGLKHGQGTFISVDGKSEKGLWEKDRLDKTNSEYSTIATANSPGLPGVIPFLEETGEVISGILLDQQVAVVVSLNYTLRSLTRSQLSFAEALGLKTEGLLAKKNAERLAAGDLTGKDDLGKVVTSSLQVQEKINQKMSEGMTLDNNSKAKFSEGIPHYVLGIAGMVETTRHAKYVVESVKEENGLTTLIKLGTLIYVAAKVPSMLSLFSRSTITIRKFMNSNDMDTRKLNEASEAMGD